VSCALALEPEPELELKESVHGLWLARFAVAPVKRSPSEVTKQNKNPLPKIFWQPRRVTFSSFTLSLNLFFSLFLGIRLLNWCCCEARGPGGGRERRSRRYMKV
jgi:hypothetical protein